MHSSGTGRFQSNNKNQKCATYLISWFHSRKLEHSPTKSCCNEPEMPHLDILPFFGWNSLFHPLICIMFYSLSLAGRTAATMCTMHIPLHSSFFLALYRAPYHQIFLLTVIWIKEGSILVLPHVSFSIVHKICMNPNQRIKTSVLS